MRLRRRRGGSDPARPTTGRDAAGAAGDAAPGEVGGPTEYIGAAVDALTGDTLPPRQRRAALRLLVGGLLTAARAHGVTRVTSGAWLVEVAQQVAPHVTVRDLPTLSAHHHGRTGDELADSLIGTASRVSAGIGAAAGALASAEYAVPPALLGAPVQLAAETLAVLGVEVKLLAELQVVYGRPVTGSPAERSVTLLTAWARGRGVELTSLAGGKGALLGQLTRRQLRERLVRRVGRSATAFGPLLTGAAIGAELNRRGTRHFGESVRDDLAARRPGASAVR